MFIRLLTTGLTVCVSYSVLALPVPAPPTPRTGHPAAGATNPSVMWDFRNGKTIPPLPYPTHPPRQQILDKVKR